VSHRVAHHACLQIISLGALPKHQYITAYSGVLLDEARDAHDNEVDADPVGVRSSKRRKFYFSPIGNHALAERFNHSCEPNCESVLSVDAVSDDLQLFIRKTCTPGKSWEVPVPLLRTKREVSMGEELTWCYFTNKETGVDGTICLCSACAGKPESERSVLFACDKV